MIRAVLDTSVLVAGLRSSNGASYALLRLIPQHRFPLIATPAIFLEYEQVLKRESQRGIHGLSSLDIDRFLVELSNFLEPVRIYYRWRPQLQDAQDEIILEAALNGRADAIITHNVKDFRSAEQNFGIAIVTPAQFLKEVRL